MERETELEERQRHDKEIADDNRARQERQGVDPGKSYETDSQPEPGTVDNPQEQKNKADRRQEEEQRLTGQEPQQYQGGAIPRNPE